MERKRINFNILLVISNSPFLCSSLFISKLKYLPRYLKLSLILKISIIIIIIMIIIIIIIIIIIKFIINLIKLPKSKYFFIFLVTEKKGRNHFKI